MGQVSQIVKMYINNTLQHIRQASMPQQNRTIGAVGRGKTRRNQSRHPRSVILSAAQRSRKICSFPPHVRPPTPKSQGQVIGEESRCFDSSRRRLALNMTGVTNCHLEFSDGESKRHDSLAHIIGPISLLSTPGSWCMLNRQHALLVAHTI